MPAGKKKPQVMNTAHSAISYFITGLSPTYMFACAWQIPCSRCL